MIKRNIKEKIIKSLKNYPITLVTGMRQIGKSTICFDIAKELGFSYISLDDLNIRQEAINDPFFFLKKHKYPLIIDEIQYAPILFEVIESIVNKERLNSDNPNGLYLFTGSQSFSLMKGITQSLAGRVNIIKMYPLSYQEIKGYDFKAISYNIEDYFDVVRDGNVDEIFKLIIKGFYPELYKNNDLSHVEYYSSYVQTYINRDVYDFLNIKDKNLFQKFMQYIASLTGCELNYDSISKNLGISVITVKEWISVLQASDIIYLLNPYYDTSITKRIIKRPKLYFTDTGLACYLVKFNDYKTLANSYFAGAFFETFAVNEIIKGLENNNRLVEELFYYRDSNQNEIDIVILENATLHLIEIKLGSSFNKSHIKAFSQLINSKYTIKTSYIICMSDNIYKIDNDIFTLPIYFL